MSRRAVMVGAGAYMPFAWQNAASATLDEKEVKSIIKRAKAQSLEVDKVIARARDGELFDPTSSVFGSKSCDVIDALLDVDKKALKKQLDEIRAVEWEKVPELQAVKERIEKQVKFLQKTENKEGCLDAFVTYDRNAVLARARDQTLTVERAVQRAKEGKLLDTKSYMGCNEMKELVKVDKLALNQQQKEAQVLSAMIANGEIVTDDSEDLRKDLALTKRAIPALKKQIQAFSAKESQSCQ